MRPFVSLIGGGVSTAIVASVLVVFSSATTITAKPSTTTAAPSQPVMNDTCESRMVNYITHGLPAVCLRNGRIGVLTDSRLVDETTTSAVISISDTQSNTAEQTIAAKTLTKEAAAVNPALKVEQPGVEDDAEALDDANFMSFEDWKKQTQERAGIIDEKRKRDETQETLETAREDGEIDMDIHAIIGERPAKATPKAGKYDKAYLVKSQESTELRTAVEKHRYRSKDAGKTCKERFNFASVDAGGQVMKANPEAKSTSALLKENRDVYVLNVCQAKNKFIIVELSDSIYVETVALANFEFFSSTFRQFRISVSARYPVKLDKWITLGTFEAQNTRDIQAFLIESPLIEARYLRVEFLNHYGNEFYCPVSLLRVHGQTMLQEVMSWERAASGEVDDDDGEEGETIEEDQQTNYKTQGFSTEEINAAKDATEAQEAATQPIKIVESTLSKPTEDHSRNSSMESLETTTIMQPTSPWKTGADFGKHTRENVADFNTCPSQPVTATPTATAQSAFQAHNTSTVRSSSTVLADSSQNGTAISSSSSAKVPVTLLDNTSSTSSSMEKNASSTTHPENSTTAVDWKTINGSQMQQSIPTPTSSKTASAISSSNAVKSTKYLSGQPPQPTTQESFFKTVTKRLQLLETNSTLSLKYIEEQSRILREAFTKVEKRQLFKTTAFLENLNITILAELRKFGRDYDQIWQSTVIELESQRDGNKKETEAVTARLNVLADELVFQKRMSLIQSVLLLLCLGTVVFSRGVAGGYIDLPAVQNLLAKSRSPSRQEQESLDDSPIPRRTGLLNEEGNWYRDHRRQRSDESLQSERVQSRHHSPPASFLAYSHLDVDRKMYGEVGGMRAKDLPISYGDSERMNQYTSSQNIHGDLRWEGEHPISQESLLRSPAPSSYVTPRRTRTLRHSHGSLTQSPPGPRINIEEFENVHSDLISANAFQGMPSAKTSHSPARKSTIETDFPEISRSKIMSSEDSDTLYLPSPPADNNEPKFVIARKPLPELPQDQ